MLTTHEHRPAAAADLDRIESALKAGFDRKSRSTCSTAARLTPFSLSKVTSDLRNASTLPMNFLAAAQDRSLATGLPFGVVRTMQADITAATSAEGEPNDLSSPSEALSRLLRAAVAAATAGSAAARSRAHSSWTAVTSSWSAAAASSSARPASAAASAPSFSTPIDSSSAAVSAPRLRTTSCSTNKAARSPSTCSFAAAILKTPASSRRREAESSAERERTSDDARAASCRKELGVT